MKNKKLNLATICFGVAMAAMPSLGYTTCSEYTEVSTATTEKDIQIKGVVQKVGVPRLEDCVADGSGRLRNTPLELYFTESDLGKCKKIKIESFFCDSEVLNFPYVKNGEKYTQSVSAGCADTMRHLSSTFQQALITKTPVEVHLTRRPISYHPNNFNENFFSKLILGE